MEDFSVSTEEQTILRDYFQQKADLGFTELFFRQQESCKPHFGETIAKILVIGRFMEKELPTWAI